MYYLLKQGSNYNRKVGFYLADTYSDLVTSIDHIVLGSEAYVVADKTRYIYGISGWVETGSKTVQGAFRFRGTAARYESGNLYDEDGNIIVGSNGDVYQVGSKEYAYNDVEWVELGFNMDLSDYVKIDEFMNILSENINNTTLITATPENDENN